MKTKYIASRRTIVTVFIFSCACLILNAQEFRVLHHFTGQTNDGSRPEGSLIGPGPVLYSMTASGGTANSGTVFRINTDGTGFALLHSFTNPSVEGINPNNSLALSGATLYGTTGSEGTAYGGTLFKLGTNGANFTVLRLFSGNDGKAPYCVPFLSGSFLYGLNAYGGQYTKGTAFRIDTNNGSQFSVLHTFPTGVNDGTYPHGSFVQVGSALYFTTAMGGSNDLGTVSKLNLGDNSCQVLHHFSDRPDDGRYPGTTSLVQSGPTLFGITSDGGSNGLGMVFRLETNGTFVHLHSFTGGAQGHQPFGALTVSGSTLYGMTSDYGSGTYGTIFSIQTNGADFRVLYRFHGWDGSNPCGEGSLLLQNGILYGMTPYGGSNNLGVIFALDARPKLSVLPVDTNVVVSWSTNYPGFTLEDTSDLTGGWTAVSAVTGYSAILPVGPDNQFFRLRQ